MSSKRKLGDDVDETMKKKHCSMCVFNKEQMFQLLSESESRLIERMDVGSGNHESQGESQRSNVQCHNFPVNSFPLQGLNNNNSSINRNLSPQQCVRCLAGEPGHFQHVNSWDRWQLSIITFSRAQWCASITNAHLPGV